MLLVCPNCATPYQVESDTLNQDGRSVRCARCLNARFATFPTRVSDMAGSDEWDVLETHPRVPSMESPLQSSEGMPNFATPNVIDVADLSAKIVSERAEQKAKADATPTELTRNTAPDPPSFVPTRLASAATKPPASRPDPATFAARRGRPSSVRRRRSRKPGYRAAILVLLGLHACMVTWRADVVRLLPQTASLYAAVGLPVNLRGLSFEDIRVLRSDHDGVAVLVLEGSIVNVTARPLEVPRLRLAVHNSAKHEIYVWTMQPPHSILGPGETLPFRSRLASPPGNAREVQVRFFSRHDMVAGLN